MNNAVSSAVRSLVGLVLTLAVTVALSGARLVAQGSAGQIEGTVRDEQGGVLPGVTMTLRNQETGVT
jgi:hypothetical protein